MSRAKGLHERNLHHERYDFEKLIESSPELSGHIIINKYKDQTVDFSNPESVIALNKALLSFFYGIKEWSIPTGHLCPPIPGRVDYIHYLADLLNLNKENLGLDIGCGTGCIYPILGVTSYNFKFIASDINQKSLESSKVIVDNNEVLKDKIELRLQTRPTNIFKNIIKPIEKFDFTICNPPFHKSAEEALKGSARKRRNLNQNKEKKGHKLRTKEELNFGGKEAELWCEGGELSFITKMIEESVEFKNNVKIFTTLVSKEANLEKFQKLLKSIHAKNIKVIEMHHGQKSSHILAWSF